MVISKIEYKKDGKIYTVDCCNKEALTVADVYTEGKLIKVEASMPLGVFYYVDVLTFDAPLEDVKIFDDTGVMITIKDVYACTSDSVLSGGDVSITYMTIEGKDYVIERPAEKAEIPKQPEHSTPSYFKKKGAIGEKVFTIYYTINSKIKRMMFWTDKATPPLIETEYHSRDNTLDVFLYVTDYSYYSIKKNFSEGDLERITLEGENQTYKLKEIDLVDTESCNAGKTLDDLYKVYIRGKMVKAEEKQSLTVGDKELHPLSIPIEEAKTSAILYKDKKEKRTMNISSIFGTNDLGKVNIDSIKYSIKGIAFLTEGGTYCVYDVDTLAATDVSNFVFETPVFILPVAAKDISRGDIIYYNQMPYIVRTAKENCIAVINPFEGKLENLIPKTSILGFSFYSKVICPFNLTGSNPTTIMNNLLPLLLMGDKNKDKNDSSELMMMMAMMNGGKSDFNSLLPLMLMNDKSDKSDMMMLMMMNNNSFAAAADKVSPQASIPTPPLNYTEI